VLVEIPFPVVDKPPSLRQKKLRRRADRRARLAVEPAPAAVALRRAMGWQAEIEAGQVIRADIARRERLTRARVKQIMSLLDLPDSMKAALLGGNGEPRGWSIRRALREVAGVAALSFDAGSEPQRLHL